MIDEKQEQINEMLSTIMVSSHEMPSYVFRYYIDSKKRHEEKIFYNLIADAFLSLFSFCKLMFENAWSQAATVLRMGIEQVASIYVLTNTPGALENYIKLHNLRFQYLDIKTKGDVTIFLKDHSIQKNRINSYFDYSWIANYTSDGNYGRNQLLELAHLNEFLVDIEETLNGFSHGSISVFEMSNNNWDVMKRHGRRASLVCCKLYDFLCCSYHDLIGDEQFSDLPLNEYFKSFKIIYLNIIKTFN